MDKTEKTNSKKRTVLALLVTIIIIVVALVATYLLLKYGVAQDIGWDIDWFLYTYVISNKYFWIFFAIGAIWAIIGGIGKLKK